MTALRCFGTTGLWGGLLLGATDGIFTLYHSHGTLSFAHQIHLVVLSACAGALAGGLLLSCFALLILLQSLRRHKHPWLKRGAVAAALGLAPLLAYDAFSLFRGSQAARVPGHKFISLGLFALGVILVLVLARGWSRFLEALVARRGRAWSWLILAGWLVTVFDLANRWILPRLYPWFHLTLTVLSALTWFLAVHAFRSIRGLKSSTLGTALTLVFVFGGLVTEVSLLRKSQAMKFYAHEKTLVLSQLLRFLPQDKRTVHARDSVIEAGPPLPPGPTVEGADVVIITLDAVRADHLSSQGYGRKTTPNLDALAQQGVLFRRAYTQAPHTSFALASLMTGKYYATLSRILPQAKHDTLAAILRRYGWKTAAFFPPAVFYIDAHKMKEFEASHFDFEYVKFEYLSAEERVGQIEAFLTAEHPQRLFLWLHLFEAHEPYEKHPGFDFGDREIDRYDSEIAYMDFVLGKVWRVIQAKRPRAILVLSADHGEEFGEHGGRYHGTTLFEEQVHVPLVMVAPGVSPKVVEGPVQVIDVPSTLLGLLNLPIPARMRGRNLGPWIADPPAPVQALPPVFAEVEGKRMVALGKDKLICALDKDYCSLFDIFADPGERHDQADAQPQKVADLRAKLDDWLATQTSFEGAVQVPGGASPALARLLERAQLGDRRAALGLAQELCEEHPSSLRVEIANALVALQPPQPETRPPLVAVLARPCEEAMANYAAVVLYSLGDETQLDRVRSLVRKDPAALQFPLYAQAALALGEKQQADGLPILRRLLDDCESDILRCRRAIRVLGQLKDPQAAPPLIANLPRVLTRHETVQALGQLADPSTLPDLVERLFSDEYVPVRAAAAKALGRIGGARALGALLQANTKEKEATVQHAISEALVQLGRRPLGAKKKL